MFTDADAGSCGLDYLCIAGGLYSPRSTYRLLECDKINCSQCRRIVQNGLEQHYVIVTPITKAVKPGKSFLATASPDCLVLQCITLKDCP